MDKVTQQTNHYIHRKEPTRMKCWLLIAVVVATGPLLVEAGRPLTVDDAGTVESQQFQLEAGAGYEHDSATQHFDFPLGLSYGVLPMLQAGIWSGVQLEDRSEDNDVHHTVSDICDFTLATKWNPLAADRFWADQALAFAVKIPTASCDKGCGSGKADFDLMYIVTKKLTDRFNADLNIGYTWVGGDDDLVHYGLALRWKVTEPVELVGEVFANTPVTSVKTTTLAMNAGIRWQAMDNLVLDAAAGAGLRGDVPDVTATMGLTWTFGFGKNK